MFKLICTLAILACTYAGPIGSGTQSSSTTSNEHVHVVPAVQNAPSIHQIPNHAAPTSQHVAKNIKTPAATPVAPPAYVSHGSHSINAPVKQTSSDVHATPLIARNGPTPYVAQASNVVKSAPIAPAVAHASTVSKHEVTKTPVIASHH